MAEHGPHAHLYRPTSLDGSSRETYIGPWLPEPVVTAPDVSTVAETGEALSLALLVVLESLSPVQRVAFVMHDIFGFSYAEIGHTLERTEVACRQLVSRSRSAIGARRPRYEPDPERHGAVTAAFVAACVGGEIESVMRLLAPDVVLTSDGGGIVSAALRPIVGADRVARFLLGLLAQAPEDLLFETAVVNGTLGIVVRDQTGNVDAVGTWAVAEGVRDAAG